MPREGDLTERVRALWTGLASAPAAFGPVGSVRVAVAPASLWSPAGWLGLVAIGGAGLVTAPDAEAARGVREAVDRGLGVADLGDAGAVRRALPLPTGPVLGPAALAYASERTFSFPDTGKEKADAIGADGVPSALGELWAACTEDEVDESGLRGITSPAFVVRDGAGRGPVVAAAGYRIWPGEAAHISVLTVPLARGRGLARTVGAAAVAHALDAGLLVQWRARLAASRRVAAVLGFRELGTQLSVEMAGT